MIKVSELEKKKGISKESKRKFKRIEEIDKEESKDKNYKIENIKNIMICCMNVRNMYIENIYRITTAVKIIIDKIFLYIWSKYSCKL